MNTNFNWKSFLAPILTALLTAALVIGGAQLWIVPVLTEAQAEGRGAGVTRFNTPIQFQSGVTIDNGLTVNSGTTILGATTASGALDMNTAVISNIGNAGTDFAANGGLTLAKGITMTTGSLTFGTVTQTGPITFGTATSVITGTLIAHGLGVTPTAILLTIVDVINSYTNTVTVRASNATSFTVGIDGGAVTLPTLYWMAGK